jgi:hypothetical protein
MLAKYDGYPWIEERPHFSPASYYEKKRALHVFSSKVVLVSEIQNTCSSDCMDLIFTFGSVQNRLISGFCPRVTLFIGKKVTSGVKDSGKKEYLASADAKYRIIHKSEIRKT